MRLLSLDISSSCTGFAIFDNGKLVKYGKLTTPEYFKSMTKNNLLMSKALFWFMKKIYSICKKNKPTIICAEDINIRHVTTMRTMSQFHSAASIGISFYDKEICLEKVHNATMRSCLDFPRFYTNVKDKKKKEEAKKKKKEADAIARKHKVDFSKYYSVNKINDLYHLNLEYKDHDVADAIALGYTYIERKL